MALLWADGFDHYGTGNTGESNMLLGPWADTQNMTIETAQYRNGTASARFAAFGYIRRVFGGAKTTVGVGMAVFFSALPSASDRVGIFTLSDNANDAQVSLVLGTTGTLTLKRGSYTTGTALSTTGVVIRAGEWMHIEVKWVTSSTASATDGTCEVRLNGAAVISYTGDVVATTLLECSQVTFMSLGTSGSGSSGSSGVGGHYVDDVWAWDTTTDANNTIDDFIGDKDVLTFVPDSDGATSDWVRESDSPSANDYSKVNATSPDGDTTYLEASTVNDTEDLGIETIPATVDGIVAAVAVNMMRKTEAGAAAVTPYIVGGSGGLGAGSAHTLTESYAYYHDVVELNPDTATAWTASTLSASSIRLKRTT